MAQEVQAHSDTVKLQADQQLFGRSNLPWIGGGVVVAAYGLNKAGGERGRKLPLRKEEAQSRLFDPRTRVL